MLETAAESETRKALSQNMVGKLNKRSAIRKKRILLQQQCKTFNKSLMCLIWVSGMCNRPWVCFHMHVGVILSKTSARRCTMDEKTFGASDGNDRNWKQIMSSSGPSSLVQSQQTLKWAFLCNLFIQYHCTWLCVENCPVLTEVVYSCRNMKMVYSVVWGERLSASEWTWGRLEYGFHLSHSTQWQ